MGGQLGTRRPRTQIGERGPGRVTATFWLIDAPDSLAVQSRREPDGVGLGVFEPDGTVLVHKRPIAAYQDAEFAREAREVSGRSTQHGEGRVQCGFD